MGWLCHSEPDLRKAWPIFHGSKALVLDMAVPVTTIRIHSGIRLLFINSLEAASAPHTSVQPLLLLILLLLLHLSYHFCMYVRVSTVYTCT